MKNNWIKTVISTGLLLIATSAMAQSAILDFVKQEDLTGLDSYLTTTPKQTLSSELEHKNTHGNTPLVVATYQGNYRMVQSLIDAGANVHVRDDVQRDLINIAIRAKSTDLVKLFIEEGVDVTALTRRYRGSTLIFASHQGQVETVRALIKAGAPLDRVNILGWTAILEAVVLGDGGKAHQEIVKLLLQAGADKSIADSNGKTPLEIAQDKGHFEMVKVLKTY